MRRLAAAGGTWPRRGSVRLARPSTIVALTSELAVLAEDVGRAWAASLVDSVRAQARDVAGGWPGTMTEARSHILAALGARARVPSFSRGDLLALSSAAYRAAQVHWRNAAVPDRDL